jgi:hypothetical protein
VRSALVHKETKRPASILPATITRQALLSHSSPSLAPTDLFFLLHPIRLSMRETVDSLTFSAATRSRNSHLSLSVEGWQPDAP